MYNPHMIVVFVSFETQEHAEKVANYLIDKKIAACVSLIPVKSYYFWKGEKMTPHEVEAIIKTEHDKFPLIEKSIQDLLAYEIPQIIAIDTTIVNPSYQKWLQETIQ